MLLKLWLLCGNNCLQCCLAGLLHVMYSFLHRFTLPACYLLMVRLHQRQCQCCDNSAMMLAILFSLKTKESLENRLQPHSGVKPLLLPANKVCEGYVFTGVCLCTGGGVCSIACWDTPLLGPEADTPLGRHPPAQCMLGYGQQPGGTYPTGMHSCFQCEQYH